MNEVREQKALVKYNIEKLNQSLVEHREMRDGAIISQYVFLSAILFSTRAHLGLLGLRSKA